MFCRQSYGAGSPAAAVAKLVSTVLVPVVAGMAIRAIPGVGERLGSKPVKSKLKLTSDVIILAIIYNTFCNTFKSGFGVATGEVTALGLVLAAGSVSVLFTQHVFARLNAAA